MSNRREDQSQDVHSLLRVCPVDEHERDLRRRDHVLVAIPVMVCLCQILVEGDKDLSAYYRVSRDNRINSERAHLAHALLVRNGRVRVDREEIRQALAYFLIVRRVGRDEDKDQCLQHLSDVKPSLSPQ